MPDVEIANAGNELRDEDNQQYHAHYNQCWCPDRFREKVGDDPPREESDCQKNDDSDECHFDSPYFG